jgi:hypothetical protein
MADVASKQQTTALVLFTIDTRTRRQTEQTKKLTNLMGNLCCATEHSVQFLVQFILHSKTAQFKLDCTGPLTYSINSFWQLNIFSLKLIKSNLGQYFVT